MASKRPATNSKISRRRIQEIELTPTMSAHPIEVKILVDGHESHRDFRDDSNLTIQITEIRTIKNRVGFAVYRMSQVANNNTLSTGEGDLALMVGGDLMISSEECHNGMFTSKVVFQNQDTAGQAYAEALNKAQQLESQGDLKTSGTVGTAFKTLLDLEKTLSELDPTGGSKIAFALCTKAWEHMEKLEKQDAELDGLVQSLARMTPVIESVQQIADANLEDTAMEMLNLIEDASLFILNYKPRTSFAKALRSMSDSSTQDQVKDLVDKFTRLKEEFDARVEMQTLKARTQALAALHSNSDRESLDKLHPVGYANYNPDRACMPGTREQVIEDIINWSQDNGRESRMLWVYGAVGLGKSSVATSVCQRLKTRGGQLATFFCRRDDPVLRDPRRLLNTIVYGLAIQNEEYKRVVADTIQKDQQICNAPIQERYASLVEAPLKSLGESKASGQYVIVIDALDETQGDENRAALLICLRKMCQLVPWLKIIVTSRPDHDIKTEFGGDDKSMTSLNLADHNATDDIRTFVRQRMAGIAKRKRIADWPDDTIRQLADRANGLFVWAEISCKFIAGGFSADERLKQVLQLSPPTAKSLPLAALDNLYTAAIQAGIEDSSADDRRHVVRCIGVIVATCTRMPLPVANLEQLLAGQIEPGVLRLAMDSLGSVVYEDGTGGPVRVSHPSFVDYITNRDRANEFYVDLTQESATLAGCCLDTMLRGLKFNICDLETSHVFNRDIPDLTTRVPKTISQHLQYSCLYWYSHLTQAEMGTTEKSLRRFLFGQELIYWLEVLSLIGRLDVALSSMTGLASLALKSHELTDCSSYANDVYRFVLSFYDPISESTPHLYISALSFAPTASESGRRMRPFFPNTLAVTQGADETWTSCLRSISHPDEVNSVAFSVDGRRIVSSCDDVTVRVWDAETGAAVLSPLRGHSDGVQCAVFSPNGRHIASGSYDHTIRIWDADTGSEVCAPLKGHSGVVYSVAFSPNGQRIVSGSADQTVRVWDAETGAVVLGPLEGHADQVTSVAFSRDGCYIASGSADNTVRVWDAETGAIVHEPLKGHSHYVTSVAFSFDGSLITSGSADRTLIIWDANTGTRKLGPLRGHTDLVQSVAFSPDDHRILSGSADGTVRFWDVESGRELVGQPRSHSHRVWCVAFAPDGRRVASASADKTVQIWDAEVGVAVQSVPERRTAAVKSVAFSSSGHLIVSGSDDHLLRIWDAATGAATREPLIGHTDSVLSVVISPDAHRVASGSADKTIRIWDLETGATVLGPLQGHSGWVSTVAFAPNGQLVASGSRDKTLRIWDATTGAAVAVPLRGHSGPVRSVAFSPNGNTLVSGSDDRTLRIWDPLTGAPLLGPLRGHSGPLYSVAFSPDGKYLASGSKDNTIRLWDAITGATVHTMRGHSDNVQSVAFSPDSQRIISCSGDRTLRIWDVKTGASVLNQLRGHSGCVRSVVFSPDGHRMASGSDDGTIRIWDADRSYILRASLSNLGGDLLKLTTSELAHLADPNGWITSANGELLMWLPGNYRGIDDSLICASPEPLSPRTMIDFSEFVHGRAWSSVAV